MLEWLCQITSCYIFSHHRFQSVYLANTRHLPSLTFPSYILFCLCFFSCSPLHTKHHDTFWIALWNFKHSQGRGDWAGAGSTISSRCTAIRFISLLPTVLNLAWSLSLVMVIPYTEKNLRLLPYTTESDYEHARMQGHWWVSPRVLTGSKFYKQLDCTVVIVPSSVMQCTQRFIIMSIHFLLDMTC